MSNFLENLYGILFEPVNTYRELDTSKPYKYPLLCVIISAIALTTLNTTDFSFGALFSKVSSLIFYWIFFAFFINLLASSFNIKGYFSKLLSLMAFSFTPWIFLAPLKLLAEYDGWINSICIILLFIIWVWTIALQIIAVSETYNIPRKNAIIIYIVPFLGTILYITWIIDFSVKLFQFSGF